MPSNCRMHLPKSDHSPACQAILFVATTSGRGPEYETVRSAGHKYPRVDRPRRFRQRRRLALRAMYHLSSWRLWLSNWLVVCPQSAGTVVIPRGWDTGHEALHWMTGYEMCFPLPTNSSLAPQRKKAVGHAGDSQSRQSGHIVTRWGWSLLREMKNGRQTNARAKWSLMDGDQLEWVSPLPVGLAN